VTLIPPSAALPPALRLRIKALLDSGVPPEDIFTRLADPSAVPNNASGRATLSAPDLSDAIDSLATERPSPSPQTPSPPEPPSAPAASPASDDHNVSLINDAKRLFSTLAGTLHARDRGAVIAFISARRGEGTSTIARDFARVAAQNSDRPVLLLDLDWLNPSHYDHFYQIAVKGRVGEQPGAAVDLGFDPSLLLRFTDQTLPRPLNRTAVTLHRIGATPLYVSRIGEAGPGLGTPAPRNGYPALWDQIRTTIGLTVIDAPAIFNSFDGLTISTTADMVVVVIEAETTRIPVSQELISRLTAQGANIAGVVLNKRRVYIPKFIYRWL